MNHMHPRLEKYTGLEHTIFIEKMTTLAFYLLLKQMTTNVVASDDTHLFSPWLWSAVLVGWAGLSSGGSRKTGLPEFGCFSCFHTAPFIIRRATGCLLTLRTRLLLQAPMITLSALDDPGYSPHFIKRMAVGKQCQNLQSRLWRKDQSSGKEPARPQTEKTILGLPKGKGGKG